MEKIVKKYSWFIMPTLLILTLFGYFLYHTNWELTVTGTSWNGETETETYGLTAVILNGFYPFREAIATNLDSLYWPMFMWAGAIFLYASLIISCRVSRIVYPSWRVVELIVAIALLAWISFMIGVIENAEYYMRPDMLKSAQWSDNTGRLIFMFTCLSSFTAFAVLRFIYDNNDALEHLHDEHHSTLDYKVRTWNLRYIANLYYEHDKSKKQWKTITDRKWPLDYKIIKFREEIKDEWDIHMDYMYKMIRRNKISNVSPHVTFVRRMRDKIMVSSMNGTEGNNLKKRRIKQHKKDEYATNLETCLKLYIKANNIEAPSSFMNNRLSSINVQWDVFNNYKHLYTTKEYNHIKGLHDLAVMPIGNPSDNKINLK